MSINSNVVEIGSNASTSSNQNPDTSSHDHALAGYDATPATSWLRDSFLEIVNRSTRIAAGGPATGTHILGIGQLEHHLNVVPTMRGPADAFHMFQPDGTYAGWRPKVATWPLAHHEQSSYRFWEY